MTVVDRHSQAPHSSRSYPPVVQYRTNQPIFYPYNPPDKPPPPGAHLYKDIWFIFKIATQVILFNIEPVPYTTGLALGALKGLYDWSEYGPPKKINSDAEMMDFGATAHTTSLVNQFCILLENLIAIAVPATIDRIVSDDKSKALEGLSPSFTARHVNRLSGKTKWPTTYPEMFAWSFICQRGICAGEEAIQRFAKWIDTPKEKKK